MASGHARLKKALVLRDALAHELGLDLSAVMRGLSTVEDTMTADLAMADGNYLAQMESLCRGDASLLTEADQAVRAACQTVKISPSTEIASPTVTTGETLPMIAVRSEPMRPMAAEMQ